MKTSRIYSIPVLLCAVLSLNACNNSRAATKRFSSFLQDCFADFTDNLSPHLNDPVIAQVNCLEIRASTLQFLFSQMRPKQRKQFNSLEGKRELLNQYLDILILAEAAQEAKFNRDKTFRLKLNLQKTRLLSALYRQYLKQTVAAISDDEALIYYDGHSQFYGPKTFLLVSHILVRNLLDAQKARGLLHEKKQTFEEVTKAMSIDKKTAAKGGSLPPMEPSAFDPEVKKVILALPVGHVSEIIKLRRGYQLVRNNGIWTRPALSFAAVKPLIKRQLQERKVRNWFQLQKESAKIEINQDKLNLLQLNIPHDQNDSLNSSGTQASPAN